MRCIMKQRESRVRRSCWALLLALSIPPAAVSGAEEKKNEFHPDAARVEQLASMLPEAPLGVGRPIDDRKAWQAVAQAPGFRGVVREAERLLPTPMPELTDELFLDFSRTGNRTRCQHVLSGRHSRVSALVLAECLENRGRFLPGIEAAIRAVCSEQTWVMPAHDRRLQNFEGKIVEIDLAVAGLSWNLATAHYWLGDRLSPELRQLIQSELDRRTFRPFEGMVTRSKPRLWWLKTTSNWNAVCLAGVTGSALAMIESPQRRAFFVAAAEKAVRNFVSGFTDDGYCSEGISYWNYGFGHFVMMAETVRQATGEQVDFLSGPKIERISRFGRGMEILPGIYPAFADCRVGSKPDVRVTAFVSRRFRMGLTGVERRGLALAAGPSSSLFGLGVYDFPNSATETPPAKGPEPALPLRDWFPDAGILICRPAPGNRPALGAALKGGHNAEHHNHNDVGSYVLALGQSTPLLDPGGEVYTARTFSSKRYESGVLNSFGHPVPRVAGQLQRTGRSAAAEIVKTEFTDESDTLVLDIRKAYGVKDLKKLQRTFVFSRDAAGSLTVIDEVEFTSPQSFGTALITFSKWKQLGPERLLVGDDPQAVRVDISTDGPAFRIQPERIEEDLSRKDTLFRLGIDLDGPVTKATITLKITPATGERKE